MTDLVTELSPSGNTPTPPTRNVHRRFVQSTLFSHKPVYPHNKPEDEDYRDMKNRRKRKSKGKVTSTNKGSKNATPKKNASANGILGSTSLNVLSNFNKVDKPKPDLRLEAKLSAKFDEDLSPRLSLM